MHPELIRVAAAQRINDMLATAAADRRSRAGRTIHAARPRRWPGRRPATSDCQAA
jgi:hypothetical protein